jgi:TPR repeat protein
MRKAVWALALLVLVAVAGGIGVWMLLLPLVPGASIKASCHEPLTQSCMDQMRALGDQLAATGQLEQAASWYAWAANGGDKVAMFELGGVNYARAIDAAARQTHSDFVANEEGRRAVVAEMTGFPGATACGWFRRAADLGYAPAMNNVGECYSHGIGFTRSGLAAIQWHLAAAQAGNQVAVINLVQDFKAGLGRQSDAAAASAWIKKRFDQMNRSDLDDQILAYTLVAGVQIPPEERGMMRQAGATIESVKAAASQASAGDTCGFFADCNALQPGAAANAAPAAAAPAQTVQ